MFGMKGTSLQHCQTVYAQYPTRPDIQNQLTSDLHVLCFQLQSCSFDPSYSLGSVLAYASHTDFEVAAIGAVWKLL